MIDRKKLEEYSLSMEHPRGKHKARVFRSVLGVGAEHADELEEAITDAIRTHECVRGERDPIGERFTLDFTWKRGAKSATVRSTWIIREGEEFPRLTSCYVL